jgi:hypothetical protein
MLGVIDACFKGHIWANQARDVFREEVATTLMGGEGGQGQFGDPASWLLACLMGDSKTNTKQQQRLWQDFRVCILPWRIKCPDHPGVNAGRGTEISLMFHLLNGYQSFGDSQFSPYTSIQDGLIHHLCSAHSSSSVCSQCDSTHFKYYDFVNMRLPRVLIVRLNSGGPGSMKVNTQLALGQYDYTLTCTAYHLKSNHWVSQFQMQGAWYTYNYKTRRGKRFNDGWHAKDLRLLWYTRSDICEQRQQLHFTHTFVTSAKTRPKRIIDLIDSD